MSSSPSLSTPSSASSIPLFIRRPSKYLSNIERHASPAAPPVEWLSRTWSVTHSTLDMWRSARNVRITYSQLPSKNNRARMDDLVEYESNKTAANHPVKSVVGVDTVCGHDASSWTWRGRGLLFFVSSHWEILAWGENTLPSGEIECWTVTWFAPTLFTKEGIDIYCSRPEGLSEDMYSQILIGLKRMEGKQVPKLVSEQMSPVEIRLPWSESDL
ncbi:hypothetical protein HOO65_010570 [Ceratocystis lukuohia]|uniref:Uncharacterized protein n=3 Tax=Ceratocystis TaxID=5157 RepID=A0A0F8DL33_CERFI|nr:hypothetical protein CFO_g1107 [Ceratocystis platani]PHH55230.1 hypothetical protein CFIMG_007486RA00001 [Ceratocystis fimbriata CBS 114723]